MQSYILLAAKIKDNLSGITYEKKYAYNELIKNKFLYICDSLDDIYEQLKLEFNKNNFKLNEEEKELKAIIPIEGFVKIKEIIFELPIKPKNEKLIIQDLIDEVAEIKKENKDLKEKLDYEIKEKNELKLKIKNLELKIENMEINFEKKINIIFKRDEFEKSSIINNKREYQNLIIDWIEEKTEKKINKIELIFKMSIHGSNSNDFHQLCDNQGPTLTLTKTINNKLFGGFNPLNWDNNISSGYIFDKSNKTFIFSLNLKKKYDMNALNKYSICCSPIVGPDFGHDDFGFRKNLKEGFVYDNERTNFLSNKNLELIGEKGEKKDFKTEELEVYKIIF